MAAMLPQFRLSRLGTAISDNGDASSSNAGSTRRSRVGQSTRELMQEFSQVEVEDPDNMTLDQLRELRRKQRASRRVSIRETLRCMWRSARPFYVDPRSRCAAWFYTIAIVIFIITETKVTVWGTDIGASIDNSIKDEQKPEFHHNLLKACGWLAINVPLHMLRRYVVGCFSYEWRRHLTNQIMEDYIGPGRAYYRMKFTAASVDNPDQRIGQDIGGFTQYSVKLMEALLLGTFTIINSSQALYAVSPQLLLIIVVASILLTIVQFGVFGARMMFLQRLALAQEADLRYGLVRVREHAESIAFYRGEEVERANCSFFFEDVLVTLYRKLNVTVFYRGTERAASGFAMLLPYAIVAPKFFAKEISFGQIYQSINLFQEMFKAMETLVSQLETMADVGANAIRVQQFQATLETMKATQAVEAEDLSTDEGEGGSSSDESDPEMSLEQGEIREDTVKSKIEVTYIQQHEDDMESPQVLARIDTPTAQSPEAGSVKLRLENLYLRVPGSHLDLMTRISLELKAGESLLICGESGSGKSSLLRAIGGLWASGSGRIDRVTDQECMFLPQEPYVCLGSLRENMTYPDFERATDMPIERTQTGASVISYFSAEVRKAFQLARIEYVLNRHGLDTDDNFDVILSRGEKQRLCFARVLIRTGVQLALLDEATSGVDEANEALLYEQLRKRVPCYVSVGHDSSLEKFHTHKLILEKHPEGGSYGRFVRIQDSAT